MRGSKSCKAILIASYVKSKTFPSWLASADSLCKRQPMFNVLCAPGCVVTNGSGPIRPEMAADPGAPGAMLLLPCLVKAPVGPLCCALLMLGTCCGAVVTAGAIALTGTLICPGSRTGVVGILLGALIGNVDPEA